MRFSLTLIAMGIALGLGLGRCEPETMAEVVVQLEVPKKTESRLQRYWFITAARGYEL